MPAKPPIKRSEVFAISPDKPFKTLKEQITLLKNRNIIIKDNIYAEFILSNVSYYTLVNGYKETFIVDEDETTFVDNITLEMLAQIHLIDLDIHSIILKYILYIERSFKTKLSYRVSEQYGVFTNFDTNDVSNSDDYLFEKHYRNTNGRRLNVLSKLKDSIIDCKPNTTTRYYKKEKNHIPPWILVNDIPLGRAIEWYKILQKDDQDYIANGMIDFNNTLSNYSRRYILLNCIYLLRDYRNKIAHGNRTFSTLVSSKLPKEEIKLLLGDRLIKNTEYVDKEMNDFYAVIVSISILMNDPMVFKMFRFDLVNALNKYKNIKYAGMDIYDIFHIPRDIDDRLISLYKRRVNSN